MKTRSPVLISIVLFLLLVACLWICTIGIRGESNGFTLLMVESASHPLDSVAPNSEFEVGGGILRLENLSRHTTFGGETMIQRAHWKVTGMHRSYFSVARWKWTHDFLVDQNAVVGFLRQKYGLGVIDEAKLSGSFINLTTKEG